MKRMFLFIIVLLVGTLAFAESYRPTTDDLYMRSYDLALGIKAESMIAAQRNAQEINQYEICDRDYNCFTVTRQPETKREDNQSGKQRQELAARPQLFVPVWQ